MNVCAGIVPAVVETRVCNADVSLMVSLCEFAFVLRSAAMPMLAGNPDAGYMTP